MSGDAANLCSMRRICVRCGELAFDAANYAAMPQISIRFGK
jgi:hypothetical protein